MATLAINGGEPVRTAGFPAWPALDPTDLEAFETIYNSKQWGVGGPKVPEFRTTVCRIPRCQLRCFASIVAPRHSISL